MFLTPIVVFGFDYNLSRTGIGRGTELRLLRAITIAERIQSKGGTPLFIVSPGRAPGVTQEEQSKTMAQMMHTYLQFRGSWLIELGEETWGTRGEVLEATRVIARKISQGVYEIKEAYLCSNTDHLRRIGVYASQVKKRLGLAWEWRPDWYEWDLPSWGLKSSLEEYAKYLTELVRISRWDPQL